MSQHVHKQLQPSNSLPSPSYDTLTSLPSMSCGSLSGPFSSFRSRNLSTTSTTSQDSCGFNMEDLVSSELCNYWHQEESNSQVPIEIGNFSIHNSVEMEQQELPHILQPMQTIPPLQPLSHNDLDMGIQKQKLKVRNRMTGREGDFILLFIADLGTSRVSIEQCSTSPLPHVPTPGG